MVMKMGWNKKDKREASSGSNPTWKPKLGNNNWSDVAVSKSKEELYQCRLYHPCWEIGLFCANTS